MILIILLELIDTSFSEFDVTRQTRKGNFLNQIDYLIDWTPIEKAIAQHDDLYQMSQSVRPIRGCCYSKCYWQEFGMVASAMK